MAALTAGRVTKEYEPRTVLRTYKMAASTQIWEGGIVVVSTSTGLAAPGSTATTLKAVGVAMQSVLSPASGTTYINVHIGTFQINADSAFAQSSIGSTCYITDDQTVSLTSTGRSIAGTVDSLDANGNPFVVIGIIAP